MHLSIVVVHYRTPELVTPALAALTADIAHSELDAEILLIDNGSDPQDRELFQQLPVRHLSTAENRGYAGGVNYGFRESTGEVVVFMNADVLVEPGCLRALVSILDDRVGVAGPRFSWDREGRLLLPPSEERGRRSELLRRAANRSPSFERRARRRWRARARRHWRAVDPIASHDLSGALLAVRREAFLEVGPFDEGYRLYFEETDWLLRARRQGWDGRYVPAARAVHLYDRSGVVEPRSREWFDASRRRFEARYYGRAFDWLARLVEGKGRDRAIEREVLEDSADRQAESDQVPELEFEVPSFAKRPLWVEVSPSPHGLPAATERIEPRPGNEAHFTWSLPAEIWHRLDPGCYRVQLVDDAGTELAVRSLGRGPASVAAESTSAGLVQSGEGPVKMPE